MKATAKIIFDRKGVATKTKAASVIIEVYIKGGKRKFISTGVKCTTVEWYNRNGIYIHNRHDADILNQQLTKQLNDIQSVIYKHGDNFNYEHLKNNDETFLEYMRRMIESRRDLSLDTHKHHYAFLNTFERFGKIIRFEDLTATNIRAFDNWLHELNLMQSTIHGYHQRLKVYIHMAMTDNLISDDPYAKISISRGKPQHRYLTIEELQRIIDLDINDNSLCRTRDLFLFQAYTGMAYADMAKLTPADVEQRNDAYYIINRRVKTGEQFYIKLLPPPLAIMQKYDFKLPIIGQQPYNRNLKILAIAANLNKNLTSHMARHTFAVWALNNGIPIEVLARILGHSNIKTTQIYAMIVQQTVDSAFDALSQKLS